MTTHLLFIFFVNFFLITNNTYGVLTNHSKNILSMIKNKNKKNLYNSIRNLSQFYTKKIGDSQGDSQKATRFQFQIISQSTLKRLSIRDQVVNGMGIEPLSRNEFLFAPNFEIIEQAPPVVSTDQMMNEKSMYSATPTFALQHGGPIVKEIISKIPSWYYEKAAELGLYPNIDVRVHDLNIQKIPAGLNLYPAIPGWHADGEFRETYFAQPDLNKVPVSFHIVSTISTHKLGVSNTQFLLTPIKMSVNEDLPDASLWQHVHKYVENIKNRKCIDMQDGNIIMFDARSLHRAMLTKNSGERLFFRMSMWHKPNLGEGKLSKQEQLYLLPKNYAVSPDLKKLFNSSSSSSQIIGTFQPTEQISILAEEQSMVGVSMDYIAKFGGPVSKNLISQLPMWLIRSAQERGLEPIADIMVFRLYQGYRPYFVDYNGNPKSIDWHIDSNQESRETQELWLSVSSHKEGVNHTQFADRTLYDGQILLTSSKNPRRELHTENRGWRYMMRIRFIPREFIGEPKIITQQYVDPRSEDTGW